MTYIHYGYKMQDGKCLVDEDKAEKVKMLFHYYLKTKRLIESGKMAGIEGKNHSGIKRILLNHHYVGDEIYPAIITESVFQQASKILQKRATKLGRVGRIQKEKTRKLPIQYWFDDKVTVIGTPYEKAEKRYALVCCEEEWDE